MSKYIFIGSILTLSFLLPGCIYKMPTEDCICTMPSTNNPTVTRERNDANSMMPNNNGR